MKNKMFRASGIERNFYCQASIYMESLYPDVETKDSQKGTKAHKAIEAEDPDAMPEDSEYVYNFIEKKIPEILAEEFSDGAYKTEKEIELLSEDPPVSGHPDRMDADSAKIVFFDYKTGRGKVSQANLNLQLATYAWLICKNYFTVKVVGYLIQPLSSKPVHRQEYNMDSMDGIEGMLEGIVKSKDDPLKFATGPHCKYCKAAAECPELRRDSSAILLRPTFSDVLDPAILAPLMKDVPLIEERVKSLKHHWTILTDGMTEEALHALGFKWKKGMNTRAITDVAAAWEAVQQFMSQAEFLKRCKITAAQIEEGAFVEKDKSITKKKLKAAINQATVSS